ncbi:DUF892 family protein [Mucilaginibacter lacusdianchii]|uniref:DUF892 family protein n=1 Tax=Mucilaginibacter lacusdianchii TaxID=2684211 RepID=UPI00131CB0DC|nr:DUF892 family protein [Mucilaginibacter sp. JXJ CY 39]
MLNNLQGDSAGIGDKINDLLIFYSLEVFAIKTQILEYLPSLANNAYAKDVKMAILMVSVKAHEELFRLRVILKLLKFETPDSFAQTRTSLNLMEFVTSNFGDNPSQSTDCRMLQHLIVIEGFQVAAYEFLSQLAQKARSKDIQETVTRSLKDAIATKADLKAMLDGCIRTLSR